MKSQLREYRNVAMYTARLRGMPLTRVIFFQDETEQAPVLGWLQELREENAKAWANCRAKIVLLNQFEQNPEKHTYAED